MDLNITSVLKLFLRELRVPVISHDAYSEIMKATGEINDVRVYVCTCVCVYVCKCVLVYVCMCACVRTYSTCMYDISEGECVDQVTGDSCTVRFITYSS